MPHDTATSIGIGIAVGLVVGFILGIYTAVYYRERDLQTLSQKIVATVVGSTWLGLHTYLILVGTGSLGFLIDVVGSAAVGELIGINMVQIVKQIRGK